MLLLQTLTAVALTVAAAAIFPLVSQAQPKITAEEAHAIGVDAYIYFYPLLSMDVFVERADAALYQAKHSGRNRVATLSMAGGVEALMRSDR